MDEFYGVFAVSFLMLVKLTEEVGGMGWGRLGWEMAKNPGQDTPRAAMTPSRWPMSHPVGCRGSGSNLRFHHLNGILHWWYHCSRHDFGGSAKYLPGKQTSEHLTFDTNNLSFTLPK